MKNILKIVSIIFKKYKFNKKIFQKIFSNSINRILNDIDIKKFIFKNKNNGLTDQIINKNFSKFNEFITIKKKMKLEKSIYKPELNFKLGSINIIYKYTNHFLKKYNKQKNYYRINSEYDFDDISEMTLQNFDMSLKYRKIVFEEALKFIIKFSENPKKYYKSIYLYGPIGVGKTYLLCAIANELANKGFNVTIIHFPTFVAEIKRSLNESFYNKNNFYKKIDFLKITPILMIDDLGAESMLSWIRDDILGIILHYRMIKKLPIFFSSNNNMKELEKHFSITQKGEVEPIKAKRIMSRIKFFSKEYILSGKNKREI